MTTQIKQLALAVFEVISKEKEAQTLISQLENLTFQLSQNRENKIFLFNPQKSLSEKQELIKKIYKNKISSYLYNLISLLIQKNILSNLDLLINYLKKLRDQKFNLTEAVIISPLSLKEEEKKEIQKIISQKINKKVILKSEIRPEILAGLVIRIEDNLIDLSLKSQLNKLKESLVK